MRTLYYGGPILTMSDPLYVPALLTGDGKILAAGEKEELRSLAPDAALLDLDGRALLPGFIDSHSHLTAYSLAQNACSVSGAADAGEIARRIRAYLEEKRPEPGSFLTVRGYDNTALPGGRHPSLEEIDAFAKALLSRDFFKISLMRELLPEPETPVTQTNSLRGMSTVMSLRLCALAPRTVSHFPFPGRRWSGTGMLSRPERYAPVSEFSAAMISWGVPWATTSPPWRPARGPMSTM